MNDHEAFLRAIFKQPEEMTVRLAFADWLDEHDHPGGELIRVRQQLSQDDLSKTKRTALARRERKLIAACDQDWLVQLERADWKLRYLRMREEESEASWAKFRQGYWTPNAQSAMTRRIAAFEKEVGKPLPRSWKAFVLGCGPGELLGGSHLSVPSNGRASLAVRQRGWSRWKTLSDAQLAEYGMPPDVRVWIRDSVYFGNGDNGDFIVWNTANVTDPLGPEYEIVALLAGDFGVRSSFGSFEAMWGVSIEERKNAPEVWWPVFLPKKT